MNATQALVQARKLWGKAAAVEDLGAGCAGTAQTRTAALEKLKAMRLKTPDTNKRTTEQRKEMQRLSADSMRYRYQVGYVMNICGMFSAFSVCGQGDTWAAAFSAAKKREKTSA